MIVPAKLKQQRLPIPLFVQTEGLGEFTDLTLQVIEAVNDPADPLCL